MVQQFTRNTIAVHDISVDDVIHYSFLIASLGLGILSFVLVIRSSCRNSIAILTILVTGMIQECYALMQVQNVKNAILEIPQTPNKECTDIHSASLVFNGVFLLLVIILIIKEHVSFKRNVLFHKVMFVFSMLMWGSMFLTNVHIIKEPVTAYMFGMDRHFAICPVNIESDAIPMVLQTCFLYAPVLMLFITISARTRGFSDIRMLSPCNGEKSGECPLCKGMEKVLKMSVVLSTMGMLVGRPLFVTALYVIFGDERIADVLPIAINLVIYIMFSLACTYNMFCAETPVRMNDCQINDGMVKYEDHVVLLKDDAIVKKADILNASYIHNDTINNSLED